MCVHIDKNIEDAGNRMECPVLNNIVAWLYSWSHKFFTKRCPVTTLHCYFFLLLDEDSTVYWPFLCTMPNFLFIFFQVPFREAHGMSGAAVHAAETKGCPLNELTVEDLKEIRLAYVVTWSFSSPYWVSDKNFNLALRICCSIKKITRQMPF